MNHDVHTYFGSVELDSVSGTRNKSRSLITVKIAGKDVQIKADTGAEATVIPYELYNQSKKCQVSSKPTLCCRIIKIVLVINLASYLTKYIWKLIRQFLQWYILPEKFHLHFLNQHEKSSQRWKKMGLLFKKRNTSLGFHLCYWSTNEKWKKRTLHSRICIDLRDLNKTERRGVWVGYGGVKMLEYRSRKFNL